MDVAGIVIKNIKQEFIKIVIKIKRDLIDKIYMRKIR